ncbi:hypothetical protein C8Q79DRAFT_592706 [Trametes meyenii]|nr:hypothetical protein C8Q79DRAFT_592706 [Trametes meyenii]
MLGRIWSGTASDGISDAQILAGQLRHIIATPASPSHICRHSSARVTQQRASQATSTSASPPSQREQMPSNSEIDDCSERLASERTQSKSLSDGGPLTHEMGPPKSCAPKANRASTHQSLPKPFARDTDACLDYGGSPIGASLPHTIPHRIMAPEQTVNPKLVHLLSEPSLSPRSGDRTSSKRTKGKCETIVEEGPDPKPSLAKCPKRTASSKSSERKRPRPEDIPYGPPLKRQCKVSKPQPLSSNRFTSGTHTSKRPLGKKRRELSSHEDPTPSAKPNEHAIPLKCCLNAFGPSSDNHPSTPTRYPWHASTSGGQLRQACCFAVRQLWSRMSFPCGDYPQFAILSYRFRVGPTTFKL